MSVNSAAAVFGAGRFGTARRARVDWPLVERLRLKGHGAQTIANMTGYSMEDVRRVISTEEADAE